MTLYKLTAADGSPVHGGSGAWPLPTGGRPGAWRTVRGPLKPCANGLHLMRMGDLRAWVREGVLWEAEAEPRSEVIDHGSKVVARTARLVRQVAVIDRRLLVTWAADCAERALPAWERHSTDDRRPREAIDAARGWLAGTVPADPVAAAAHAAAAADSAAHAAAAYYADAAAHATSAAHASAAAAADAAAAAERDWQTGRLAGLLGIEADR